MPGFRHLGGLHYEGPAFASDRAPGGGDFPSDVLSRRDWAVLFDDFLFLDSTNIWTGNNNIGAGPGPVYSASIFSQTGGVFFNNVVDTGSIMQSPKIGFFPTTSGSNYRTPVAVVATRINLVNAANSGFFFGFSLASPTLLGTTGILTSDTHAGFHYSAHADPDGQIRFTVAGQDDTAAVKNEAVATVVAGQAFDMIVRVEGTISATGWIRPCSTGTSAGGVWTTPVPWIKVNGGTPTTVWNAKMIPTLASVAATATTGKLHADYIWCATARDV